MTRKSRLLGGVVFAAAAALVLSGCSTNPPAPSGAAGSSALTVFWKGSEKPGIDAVVAAYKTANPKIDVTVTTADVEQYQSTLRTQLSAGTATDVVFVWPADGNPAAIKQIAPGGFLEDLSDRSWASKYPDSIKQLTEVDGKTYLMAPAVTSFGPWYNETALTGANLTAPATWSDVIPFCQAARSAGKVAYALGASTLNNTQNPLYGLVPDTVYAAEPKFDADLASGKTTFSTDKGWKTAMDEYQQMIKAGCFSDNSTGLTQDDQNKAVANGDALAMFGIGFQLSSLRSLNPNATFLIHPFSGDDDTSKNLMTISNAGGAAVNVKAKNKANADAFVDFLAEPENIQIYNDALAGTVPSIPTGKDSTDPNLTLITDYLSKGQAVHFLNQFWPNAQTEQAMYSNVQGMLAGTAQPSDVLSAMDAAYKKK